jgi:hypothetical protein
MASGSFRDKEERCKAQAISQVWQATHRSVLTKMDFMLSSKPKSAAVQKCCSSAVKSSAF